MNFCERRVGEVINVKRCEFVGCQRKFPTRILHWSERAEEVP